MWTLSVTLRTTLRMPSGAVPKLPACLEAARNPPKASSPQAEDEALLEQILTDVKTRFPLEDVNNWMLEKKCWFGVGGAARKDLQDRPSTAPPPRLPKTAMRRDAAA